MTDQQQTAKAPVDLASHRGWPTVEDLVAAYEHTNVHEEARRVAWINAQVRDFVLAGSRLGRRGAL